MKENIIRDNITITQVLEHYGIGVNRAGMVSCPFHEDIKNNSMKIYTKTNTFFCFGCGVGGSVIDFVMKFNGCGFVDSFKIFENDFGLNLGINKRATEKEKIDLFIHKHKMELKKKKINGLKRRKENKLSLLARERREIGRILLHEPKSIEEISDIFINALNRREPNDFMYESIRDYKIGGLYE